MFPYPHGRYLYCTTPLAKAIKVGDEKAITDMLFTSPLSKANVLREGNRGDNALHIAIKKGRNDLVRHILRMTVNFNETKKSYLEVALSVNNTEACRLLLRYGHPPTGNCILKLIESGNLELFEECLGLKSLTFKDVSECLRNPDFTRVLLRNRYSISGIEYNGTIPMDQFHLFDLLRQPPDILDVLFTRGCGLTPRTAVSYGGFFYGNVFTFYCHNSNFPHEFQIELLPVFLKHGADLYATYGTPDFLPEKRAIDTLLSLGNKYITMEVLKTVPRLNSSRYVEINKFYVLLSLCHTHSTEKLSISDFNVYTDMLKRFVEKLCR